MTTEPGKEPDTMTSGTESQEKANSPENNATDGLDAPSPCCDKPKEGGTDQEQIGAQKRRALYGFPWLSVTAWTALATVVIAAATSIYTYVSIRQLGVIGDQIEEMRSDRRPWIYADISLAAPIEFDASGMRVTLKFGLHNTGREPARFVSPEWQIYSGRVTFDMLSMQKTLCEEIRARGIGRNTPGTTLFPGQEFTYLITTTMSRGIIDADLEAQAAAGTPSQWLNTISPVIVGCTTYRPVSGGQQYQTGFIFEMWDKGTDTYALSGNLIFVLDKGEIPAERISLVPSLQGGAFYAD